MTIRGILIGVAMLVALFAAVIVAVAREHNPGAVAAAEAKVVTDGLAQTKTVKNRSYVPLNLMGGGEHHVDTILGVLAEFEKRHPELEVVDWKIQEAHMTSGYVFGIWIDHKPR